MWLGFLLDLTVFVKRTSQILQQVQEAGTREGLSKAVLKRTRLVRKARLLARIGKELSRYRYSHDSYRAISTLARHLSRNQVHNHFFYLEGHGAS